MNSLGGEAGRRMLGRPLGNQNFPQSHLPALATFNAGTLSAVSTHPLPGVRAGLLSQLKEPCTGPMPGLMQRDFRLCLPAGDSLAWETPTSIERWAAG